MDQLTNKEFAKDFREGVMQIEKEMLEYEQVEMPVKHHFSKDLYARELFIPAGTILVGKIHKHESLNILSQGDISLLTEEGVTRVQAPYTVVSKPGIKRIGYAHTDCVWITAHATKETEIDKIEDEVIAKTYDDVPLLTDQEIKQIEQIEKE
jgi:hypothetical protein